MSGQRTFGFGSKARPSPSVQVRTTSARSETSNTVVQQATTVHSGSKTVIHESKQQTTTVQQRAVVTEVITRGTPATSELARITADRGARAQPSYVTYNSTTATKLPPFPKANTTRSYESLATKTSAATVVPSAGWRDKFTKSLLFTKSPPVAKLENQRIKMDARPYGSLGATIAQPSEKTTPKTYVSPYTNRAIPASASAPLPPVNAIAPARKQQSSLQTAPKANFRTNWVPFRGTSKSTTAPLKPGDMFIFNNENFENRENEARNGSARDVEVLRNTFASFQMNIKLIKDAKLEKIQATISTIERTDYSRKAYLVIAILSHGTRNNIISAKDRSYSLDDVVIQPILRNRTLSGKPKIFLVQACKGTLKPGGFATDSSQPNGEPNQVLVCYSTFEGYLSYRDEKEGTPFIQALCHHLKESGHTEDIIDIMKKVIRTVEAKTERKQTPIYSASLTDKFVFGDYCST